MISLSFKTDIAEDIKKKFMNVWKKNDFFAAVLQTVFW